MNGLKEAAAATKRMAGPYGGHIQISYNIIKKEVLHSEHADQNSYTRYDNPNIIHICNTSNPMTKNEILDLINQI